jgi:hypothetical protein
MKIHQLNQTESTSQKTEIKEWLNVREVAELMSVSERTIQRRGREFETKIEKGLGGERILIKFSSLPFPIQNRYYNKHHIQNLSTHEIAEKQLQENELAIYNNVPEYKRKKARKYLAIFNAAQGLKGNDLKDFINNWNILHPEDAVSLQSYYREVERYKAEGVTALFAGYGSNEGATNIEEIDFIYFQKLYLKEGGPTLKSCWLETYGNYIKRNVGVIPDYYPSMSSFIRLLKMRVPQQSIELARRGERYWNRKRAGYCERDWSKVKAGQCWFSDHRQADQAMMRSMTNDEQKQIERLIKYEGKDKGKPVFPWITFWADAKTKKMLSILPHEESPTSDHIFLSFYMAIEEFGLPDEIYIDNGKDYRCRDFAGGKRKIRIEVNEVETRSLMHFLGIEVHFSKPYRGQSKTIERTFRIMKEWLDKQMPGYRGGNIVERPEKLAHEIKQGAILNFDDYCELLEYFFKNILNKFESDGKILNGKSADQVWAEEFKIRKAVDRDSLKLLCMRSSKDYSIDKDGIIVSKKYKLHYWGDWMIALKGNKEKYYMRRDPKQYQFAWVFNSRTHDYVGKATLNVWKTDALAKTDLEKAQLNSVLRLQANEKRIVKSYLPDTSIDPREILENLAAGIAATSKNDENAKAEVMNLFVRTSLDEVQQKQEEMQKTGTYGTMITPMKNNDEPRIVSFLTDKERSEKENADQSRED